MITFKLFTADSQGIITVKEINPPVEIPLKQKYTIGKHYKNGRRG